jgi:hypothetical protein
MFQTARVLTLPGVKTTMTLDPRSIPPRLRKMAARMIEDGVAVGGWSSKSAKIAQIVAENFGISLGCVRPSNHYTDVPKDDAVRAEVVRIMEVDLVQYLLQDHGRYFDPTRVKDNHRTVAAELVTGERDWAHFYSKARMKEAVAVSIAYHRKQAVTDHRHKQAARFLMEDTPMALHTIPPNV